MRKKSFRLWIYAALVAFAIPLAVSSSAGNGKKTVMVITLNGIINPVSAEYITKSITAANADSTIEALVMEMDTPGGLDTSMRQIIKKMQASSTPIVVYVAPSGSRAASAGAYITMAAHVAAMAPGTNIGSASPVSMGGGMDRTMKKKVTNDAAAYIRSLAKAHGRNEDMGEKFVRKAASIQETEALKENVIDLIAGDLTELLKSIDGRTVKTVSGERKLATAGLAIKRVGMTWRQQLFDTLANPNIAYMLMMLGFYGLFFELSNPGAVLPGVIGAICLILGFYSMQAIPINYAGALLMLMGVIMFILEIWVISFGMLTIGGLAALVIGSLMLVDSPEEYLKLSLMVVLPIALFTAAFFGLIITAGIRAQSRKSATGKDALIGSTGKAESEIAPGKPGKIFIEGELWNANTDDGDIKTGDDVEITGYSGLTLTVKAK